jgi:hypothetical protein
MPTPLVEHLTDEVPLDWLQERVHGYIERVPHFDCVEYQAAIHPCVAFCNEEGKLKGMAYNAVATELWAHAMPYDLRRPDGQIIDVLCGPVVVLFGDAEFMAAL